MKHKILISGALVLAATAAHASFTVTLDNPNQSLVQPLVPTDVVYTGHIHKDVVGTGASTITTPAQLADFTNELDCAVNFSDFFAFAIDPNATDFFGELLRIHVKPTDLVGLHGFYDGGNGHSGLQFFYDPVGAAGIQLDSGFQEYSLDIQPAPVPEPATMAVLGVGALAALRRRRRKAGFLVS